MAALSLAKAGVLCFPTFHVPVLRRPNIPNESPTNNLQHSCVGINGHPLHPLAGCRPVTLPVRESFSFRFIHWWLVHHLLINAVNCWWFYKLTSLFLFSTISNNVAILRISPRGNLHVTSIFNNCIVECKKGLDDKSQFQEKHSRLKSISKHVKWNAKKCDISSRILTLFSIVHLIFAWHLKKIYSIKTIVRKHK